MVPDDVAAPPLLSHASIEMNAARLSSLATAVDEAGAAEVPEVALSSPLPEHAAEDFRDEEDDLDDEMDDDDLAEIE